MIEKHKPSVDCELHDCETIHILSSSFKTDLVKPEYRSSNFHPTEICDCMTGCIEGV